MPKSFEKFIFIKISNQEIKRELIKFLEQEKIFIRDYGHIQQTENFVRFTIGLLKQMERVINALNTFETKFNL